MSRYDLALRSTAIAMLLAVCGSWNPMVAVAQFDEQSLYGDSSAWWVRTGALFLDGGGSLPDRDLVTRSNRIPEFNSNAIDPGTGVGWEIACGAPLSETWTIDARYFKVNSLYDEIGPTHLPVDGGVAYSDAVFGLLGAVENGAYSVRYDVDLESFDVMARHDVTDWLRLGIGLRYLRFEDAVGVVISGSGFTSVHRLSASNEMFGAQCGADVLLLRYHRLEWLVSGLAALYHNDLDASLARLTIIPDTNAFNGSRTSFSGELETKARLRLCRSLSIEAGYRLLWIERIALASEQAAINPVLVSGPMRAIDSQDSRFLHGATVGLVAHS